MAGISVMRSAVSGRVPIIIHHAQVPSTFFLIACYSSFLFTLNFNFVSVSPIFCLYICFQLPVSTRLSTRKLRYGPSKFHVMARYAQSQDFSTRLQGNTGIFVTHYLIQMLLFKLFLFHLYWFEIVLRVAWLFKFGGWSHDFETFNNFRRVRIDYCCNYI